MATTLPEVWLRGPVEGVPALLQPVAHALLQASEEVNKMMENFPEALLWERPSGMASPGFHLQHLSGVLDRLFTYARGVSLSAEQLSALKAEGIISNSIHLQPLVQRFNRQVQQSVEELKRLDEKQLTDVRTVGRAALPSTVIGLLVHAAEHTMRHTGQLLVTVNVLKHSAK
jgi:uncharacterized damage-inducible protein DinB